MIKKHQKSSIYTTYQKTSLKQLLKKTFEPNQKTHALKKTCEF